MAFDNYGRFVPDALVPQAPRMNNSSALPGAASMMFPSNGEGWNNPAGGIPLPMMPQASPNQQRVTQPLRQMARAMNPAGQLGQYSASQPPLSNTMPGMGNVAQNQTLQFQGQYQPQYPQMNYYYPQPQAPQYSVEQSVQNGNPQSVQNFLTALNKVGAGNNNTFMNQPGAQGAGPQAGFQGFQQNGAQMPQTQSFGPTAQFQQMNNSYQGNTKMGWAGNQASYGQLGSAAMPQAYSQGIQQGGTGGVSGQPQNFYLGANPNGTAQQNSWAQNKGLPSDQYNQINPYAAMSDVNTKTEIAPAQSELQDFLNSLGVYSYEYKDKKYGEGRRISPMAQEIESTPLGQAAISTNQEGYKQVDYGKLAGTQLAATAYMNYKVNKLEAKIKDLISQQFSKKGK